MTLKSPPLHVPECTTEGMWEKEKPETLGKPISDLDDCYNTFKTKSTKSKNYFKTGNIMT